jgi:hypothetical protein
MKKFNSKNRVFLGALMSILFLSLGSCVWFLRVDAPSEVETHSTFDVRLVIDDHYPGNDGHNHAKAWGFLGAQLPLGWTINEEELEYEYFPALSGSGHTSTEYHTGPMVYAEEYLANCFTNEFLEDGYFWTGFSTTEILSECMDSIVVHVKIHTDGQLGDKALTFVFQENGDEEVPWGDPETKKPLYPIDHGIYGDTPKPAARKEGDDNGNGATRYVEIKAIQGTGTTIQTVTKDASFNVTASGDGQLQVKLSDSKAIGAKAAVYNLKGQIIATQTLNQTETIVASGLPAGVYAVTIEKDGVRSVKKAVVK